MKFSYKQLANIENHSKREDFCYGEFDVTFWYYAGMFRIELISGWDYEAEVPEYGFGTGFGGDVYYAGFDNAYNAVTKSIKNSNANGKIKLDAYAALMYVSAEFRLTHQKRMRS